MNTNDEYNDDFWRGWADCRNGEPHKLKQSSAYDRGYGLEYMLEQTMTEMGLREQGRK